MEVKDIYAIHIIIYYIDGGEMERGRAEGNVRHVAHIRLYVCVYSLYVV